MERLNVLFYENKDSKKYIYYNETKKAIQKKARKFHQLKTFKDLEQQINKVKFKPDVLIIGYGATDLSEKNLPDLRNIKIPKFIYLNKEYHRLQYKLDWIKNQNFRGAFTVLNKTNEFSSLTNTPFYNVNFAVNPDMFSSKNISKSYDISFSGVIRKEQDNDIRRKVMNELFEDAYWYDKRIVFSSHLKNTQKQYVKHLCSSKVIFSSTGPADIVGTRYFEAMATGQTQILSNVKDNVFSNLFENEKHFIGFTDVKQIKNLYEKFVLDEKKRDEMLISAKRNVLKNHTWKNRADQVFKIIYEEIQ